MTHQSPASESLLELYEALARHQLRDAGAEVASAIAHAVGTPLNVISGRAELIRHDPSNALAQVARIEEQVKKLATGLRQIVDYLAVPEPRAASAPATSARAGGDAGPAAPAAAALPPAAPPLEVSDAKTVLRDVLALAEPAARAAGVEVAVDGAALSGARVERWHALGTLNALVSAALRQAGSGAERGQIRIGGTLGAQGVTFELQLPGVSPVQGWQLEHFHSRPTVTEGSDFHRTMSICATIVRGHGGRLQAEPSPDGRALVVRFSCRNEGSAPA